MAEESEKRFHSIMDKLFQSPKTLSSSLSGGHPKVGQKRPNSESALALVDPKVKAVEGSWRSKNSAEAPLCRPWDRGDLMRRLATFKSMTWFAKPKVVSAVNCARRGWINIDIDIIACEACGARLLFSTPSAWTQQQVEKAALVFSLKLESGHKPVCPWIDNACDERLAEFPPTPYQVLVEKFNDRSSALSQLQALPVISSSAIENMRSPQMEEFIGLFPTLEHGNKSVSLSQIEPVGNGAKANSRNFYYQAQKLISLCGWEPRSLPYIVECKERSKHFAKEDIINTSHLVSHISSGSSPSVAADTSSDAIEGITIVSKEDIDPNSAVLDCKLCGASVGLWAFSLVPRPLELLRVIGLTAVNSRQKSTQESGNGNLIENTQEVTNSLSSGKLTFANSPSNLNKTIAGGPLPTKQDFKATITVPVIGQNLRARFSYDSEFRDRPVQGQEGTKSAPSNTDVFQGQKNLPECDSIQQVSQPEAGILSKSVTAGGDQSSSLQHENSKKGFDHHDQGDPSCEPVEASESVEGASCNAGVVFSVPDTTADGNSTETDPLLMISFDNLDQEHFLEVDGSSGKDNSCNMERIEGETSTGNQTLSTQKCDESIKEKEQNSEVMTNGTDDKQFPVDNLMEFDPIRQHRHYCPWILSTASGPPGWQQTLSALLRQNQHSSPSNSPSTPSTVMVKDPIGSVRKLFMSPSTKRIKLTPGSNERAGHS